MPDPAYLFEPVFYEAITPIHVGSGQDVGIVDMPVVRERATGHPYLPGSGIRGVLRDRCEKNPEMAPRLFGSDPEGELSAGCVSVLDAHLLLFPVRSSPEVFHWVTCPYLLNRYRELHTHLVGEPPAWCKVSDPPGPSRFRGGNIDSVHLEEYAFAQEEQNTWTWKGTLPDVVSDRVLLLSDTDLAHFSRLATIVRQRNRLSTAKTVVKGQLFSIEMVPDQSWFFGFLGSTRERRALDEGATPADGSSPSEENDPMSKEEAAAKLRTLLTGPDDASKAFVQIGGQESVGLGLVTMHWLDGRGQGTEDEQ